MNMKLAFQQRRMQILGDCKQLRADGDSYNENRRRASRSKSFLISLSIWKKWIWRGAWLELAPGLGASTARLLTITLVPQIGVVC